MIACRGVSKRYGRTIAADGISFTVPDGQVTGLLGPNGAGKTTAIRAVVGLAAPDAGAVMVDGIDVVRRPAEARARLGVLPEAAGLYDRLTVREHLAYSAALYGLTRAEADARVETLIARLGLASIADRLGSRLSLGEARRVALGRALLHQPNNVVLDEPTNGLDVPSARELRREVRRLADAGCAVLFSSHVMPEVSAVCDRVVVLAAGRVVAEGTPAEIQQRAGAATLEDAFVTLIGSEEGLN